MPCRHSRAQAQSSVVNVTCGECELTGLKSFTIYEISITAVNDVGFSDSVKLIQITGTLKAYDCLLTFRAGNLATKTHS